MRRKKLEQETQRRGALPQSLPRLLHQPRVHKLLHLLVMTELLHHLEKVWQSCLYQRKDVNHSLLAVPKVQMMVEHLEDQEVDRDQVLDLALEQLQPFPNLLLAHLEMSQAPPGDNLNTNLTNTVIIIILIRRPQDPTTLLPPNIQVPPDTIVLVQCPRRKRRNMTK